ncbi:hypothetical protein SAURM35S_09743 [Streptomyces aurantiogriseus]
MLLMADLHHLSKRAKGAAGRRRTPGALRPGGGREEARLARAALDHGVLVAGASLFTHPFFCRPPSVADVGDVGVGAVVVLPPLLRGVLLDQGAAAGGAAFGVGAAALDHGVLVAGGVFVHAPVLLPPTTGRGDVGGVGVGAVVVLPPLLRGVLLEHVAAGAGAAFGVGAAALDHGVLVAGGVLVHAPVLLPPTTGRGDAGVGGVGAVVVLPPLLRGVLLGHVAGGGAAFGARPTALDHGVLVAGGVLVHAPVLLPPTIGRGDVGGVGVGAVVVLPSLLRGVLLDHDAAGAGAAFGVGATALDGGVLVAGGVLVHAPALSPPTAYVGVGAVGVGAVVVQPPLLRRVLLEHAAGAGAALGARPAILDEIVLVE